MPAAVVRAGWVIGEVEVNHQPAIGLPEVGVLDAVQQIAATPVGSIAIGLIAKWDEDPAAVAQNPEERERDRLPANLEVHAPEALDAHHAIMFQRNLEYYWLNSLVNRQQKAKRGIVLVVAQAVEAVLLRLR